MLNIREKTVRKNKLKLFFCAILTLIETTCYFNSLVSMRYAINAFGNYNEVWLYAIFVLSFILVATVCRIACNYHLLKLSAIYEYNMKLFLISREKIKDVNYHLFINGSKYCSKFFFNYLKMCFLVPSTIIYTLCLTIFGNKIFDWYDQRSFTFFVVITAIIFTIFICFYVVSFFSRKTFFECYNDQNNLNTSIEKMLYSNANNKQEILYMYWKKAKIEVKCKNYDVLYKRIYDAVSMITIFLIYIVGFIIFPEIAGINFKMSSIAFMILFLRKYISNFKCVLELIITKQGRRFYINQFQSFLDYKINSDYKGVIND